MVKIFLLCHPGVYKLAREWPNSDGVIHYGSETVSLVIDGKSYPFMDQAYIAATMGGYRLIYTTMNVRVVFIFEIDLKLNDILVKKYKDGH